jgi:hypothetical protein
MGDVIADLRRAAITAGIWLRLGPIVWVCSACGAKVRDSRAPLGARLDGCFSEACAGPSYALELSTQHLTRAEAEQLTSWLLRWQEQHVMRDPPAGFELFRHVWCPADRDETDPLGTNSLHRIAGEPWVKPAAPEVEVGTCGAWVRDYDATTGKRAIVKRCRGRRLYRWGVSKRDV